VVLFVQVVAEGVAYAGYYADIGNFGAVARSSSMEGRQIVGYRMARLGRPVGGESTCIEGKSGVAE